MMVTSTFIVIAAVCTVFSAQTDSCERQKDFVELLHELIETKINGTLRDDLALLVEAEVTRIVTGTIDDRIEAKIDNILNIELENRVKDHLNNALADEPVLRTFGIDITPSREVTLSLSDERRGYLSISNPSVSVTSSNNLLAYRPRYRDSHRSNLGVMFFNIEGIFPCINSTSYYPTCGILTSEEDGFFQGRPFIQAGDRGNSMRIFSSTENIRTYGFAIQGCAEFSTTCFRNYVEMAIFCLLPRPQCG